MLDIDFRPLSFNGLVIDNVVQRVTHANSHAE